MFEDSKTSMNWIATFLSGEYPQAYKLRENEFRELGKKINYLLINKSGSKPIKVVELLFICAKIIAEYQETWIIQFIL